MKRGGGIASDDDIEPEVLADLGQGEESAAARAVEGLKLCGLLIRDGDGWTTPNWREFQPDPTGSSRQRAMRERNKTAHDSVTVRNGDVTVRNGDVTSRNGVSRSVTPDRTGQDIQDRTQEVVVVAEASRATSGRPSATPTTTPASMADISENPCDGFPPDFGAVESAFRATQSGRYALSLSPADLAALLALTRTHGAPKVVNACGAAADGNNRERVSVAFVRAILANEGRAKPPASPRGGQRAGPWVQDTHEPMKRDPLFDQLGGGHGTTD